MSSTFGEAMTVDFSGAVRGGVATDTSDRARWSALDAMPSPVVVVDGDGKVVWTNAAWTHHTRDRWARTIEAEGAHYIAACRQGGGYDRHALDAIGTGLRAVLGGQRAVFEHELTSHADVAEAWYTVTVSPCSVDGRRGAMVQHVDVTDVRQADRRRVVARAVARAMERDDARREMLQGVVATVCEVMGWSLAAMWSWDHASGVLRCDGVQPRSLTTSYGWSAVSTSAGLAARVWGDHEPRWSEEIDREDASVMRAALGAQSEHVREALAVPLGRDGHVDGVVVFYSTHRHRPEAALVQLLAMLFTGARWTPATADTRGAALARTQPEERDASRSFASLAAQSQAPVLIRGERGAGKAYLAREIHRRSERARGPYVECNCAALRGQAAEDELFGYEAGAIPGASRPRRGLLEEAAGGTLVLRDVGALDLPTQARLVKALEAGTFRRLGGAREMPLDARIVTTSTYNLQSAAWEGAFNDDLLRFVTAIVVEVPALRARSEEFEAITRRVVDDIARVYNRAAPSLAPEAIHALRAQKWQCNIRELRLVLERAWLGVGDEITAPKVVAAIASMPVKAANDTAPLRRRSRRNAENTPEAVAAPSEAPPATRAEAPVVRAEAHATQPVTTAAIPAGMLSSSVLDLLDPESVTLAAFERAHIERVLRHNNYNMRRAAQMLGISRSTLYIRTREYKLNLEDARRNRDEEAANDTDMASSEEAERATGT